MATSPVEGKTILQLVLHQGAVELTDTYLEIHVEGAEESVKIPLSALPIKGDDGAPGKSALEVVQEAYPEVQTPEQFVELLTGPQGKSPYDIAVDNGFVGTPAQWLDSLVGAAGKSAYELAVAGGYEGDEQEWLASLQGKDGQDGEDGADGKSAFELAQAAGFPGTEAEWLASLEGPEGKSAYDVAVAEGYTGTRPEWIASLQGARGEDGKSAYQLAVDAGYPGTESEWLASLKGADGNDGQDGADGEDGATGKSAYQIAVDNGFVGTEPQWLASLVGKTGVIGVFQGQLDSVDDLPPATDYEANDYFWVGKNIHMVQQGVWIDLGDFSGPAGRDGTGLQILGELPSVEYLPEGGDRIGDTWLIAKSMWVWNGTRWQEQGQEGLKGDKGDRGDRGPEGKSALQVLSEAYPQIVTAEDMALFLKGEKGEKGDVSVSWVTDGVVENAEGLPDPGVEGHGWLVGAEAPYDFHLFVNGEWVNLGNNSGPQGIKGDKGDDGGIGPRGFSYVVKGTLESTDDLPTVGNNIGEAYRINKHDYVWNGTDWVDGGDISGPQGERGLTGATGAPVNPKGQLPTVGDLPTTGMADRDAYEIQGNIWVYNATDAEFKNMGPWRGTNGAAGKSAYDIAVDNGFAGDQAAWLASLQGAAGNDGQDGSDGQDGQDGQDGAPGKDVEFVGDFADEASLPTEQASNQIATAAGRVYRSTGTAWIDIGPVSVAGADGQDGVDGKSAFQLAQDAGFQGTEAEWLASLIGAKGDDGNNGEDGAPGQSAYELAVAGGYEGDQASWLLSLKGADGQDGNDGSDGNDGLSVVFVGDFADEASLPAAGTANQEATAAGRVYRSNGTDWVDVGPVGAPGQDGQDGTNGTDGTNGKSAFEIAQDAGFPGDEAAWLLSLKGADGQDGDNGQDGADVVYVGDFANQAALPATTAANEMATAAGRVYRSNGSTWVDTGAVGVQGEIGDTGKSAFELAQDEGFEGDLQAWLASLKGATGASLYEQAVSEGKFTGTLDEFIEAQRGPAGLTAFEEAQLNGFEGTFEEFVESLRGPQGNEGERGLTGETGPAIRIVGEVADEASLPATGEEGTGYAVPDASAPGTFDCWIWLSSTSSWFNLGHVVGATGPKGDQGIRGLQGLKGDKGDKGDQGTLWIVLDRDPQALDGRVGDYFYNRLTQAFFRKTDSTTWAPLGFIGGGNLNAPTADGIIKVMLDGNWINAPILSLPSDNGQYILKNGQWVTLDAPDGKVVETVNTVNFSEASTFRITNNGNKTITITGLPAAGRSATRVLKIRGKTGSFAWTPPAGVTLRWFGGTPPTTFENDITTIVLHYDGLEIVASIPD